VLLSRHRLCRRQAALHGASGGTASANGMPESSPPPNSMARHRTFTACNGVGVGEDAVKIVSTGLTKRKFRDAECADITYVGARRPCPAFLGRRVRQSNARNVMAQAFIA